VSGEDQSKNSTESCFYICPIGKSDSVVRKRTDQIFKHVVKATLEPLGYSVTEPITLRSPARLLRRSLKAFSIAVS
jgi:hypothetical protein